MSCKHISASPMMRCIEADVKTHMGLHGATIHVDMISRAVQKRLLALHLIPASPHQEVYLSTQILSEYLLIYERTAAEKQYLTELLVVPETWFFRYQYSFDFMICHIQTCLKRYGQPLSILSLPCSTGEEPYSIAMSLLDAGIDKHHFRIDAVDISQDALAIASAGVYTRNSFRSRQLAFRHRYFTPHDEAYRIHDHVRSNIHFFAYNVVQSDHKNIPSAIDQKKYSIIFCRNLLIYFDAPTQQRVLKKLSHMLYQHGLLFVGHGETGAIHQLPDAFTQLNSKAFVYQKQATNTPPSKTKAQNNPQSTQTAPSPLLLPQNLAAKPMLQRKKASSPPLSAIQQQADMGQLSSALTNCLTYVKTNAHDADAWVLLGMIYTSRNQQTQAIKALKKAFYLQPNHEEALSYLALWADHLGQLKQAERYRHRLKQTLPKP